MKLWFTIAITMIFFSGCSSQTENLQLQNKNAKQKLLIQQQQAQIDALKVKLGLKKAQARKRARAVAKKRRTIPVAPKKNIKLKKVEDNNYTSGYMYPGEHKKKKAITVAKAETTSTSMGKAGCIAMIGQEKFDKYTQMFGSESASIKRCNMLKAMR